MASYDVWFHDCLGWFAIRLESGTVTAVAGPLEWATVRDYEFDPASWEPLADDGDRIGPLPRFDDREAAISRSRDTPEQFMPLDRWLKGGVDFRPRPLRVEVAWSLMSAWGWLLRRWLGF